MQCACEATGVEGFVQRVVVLAANKYYYWVSGTIPEDKNPEEVDRRLIEKYGLAISRSKRARQKKRGIASVQYIRLGRSFVLMATEGIHAFWQEELERYDLRKNPMRVCGYSISVREDGAARHEGVWRERVSVRLDKRRYLELRDHYLELARRDLEGETLRDAFFNIPYQPFAPIRRQIGSLRRQVNAKRKLAGLSQVPKTSVRFRKGVVRQLKPVLEERTDPRRKAAMAAAADQRKGVKGVQQGRKAA